MSTWNTMTGAYVGYLDNVPFSLDDVHQVSNGYFDVPYSGYTWNIGVEVKVYSIRLTEYLFYEGSLAEMFFLSGAAIDIAQAGVRAHFIDQDTLMAVPIDAGGYSPFGPSLGLMPDIYLAGNENLFPLNFPAWLATDGGKTPPNPSTVFSTAFGALTTAETDPFDRPGVACPALDFERRVATRVANESLNRRETTLQGG
jgi:hypothetical protein